MTLAKRIVRLEEQAIQIAREKQKALDEYNRLLATNGLGQSSENAAPPKRNGEGSLRTRIQMYLEDHPGVRLSLHDIERAIGAQDEHRRVIWTLANMKRDGLVRNEKRGFWSVGRKDGKDDDDIPF